ncbi:hypothetical protein J2S46_005862 [Kitasatospora herbaricolor]|uniref:transglycosylase family protein n=1 Tax=Kitasatospora herbaricolor TaxID=68217 RepID=UPI00227D8C4C|nr:transglycosylase family protein [Kitasatospora herbaricolor]MDQ0311306.1 hypothetical protein [Kitasatospora herbaricolor]
MDLPPAAARVPAAPVRPAVHDAVWDELAQCESSGDWRADTGNGYYGGLQIWPPTWAEAGGPAFADRPDHATRREQIVVAEQILRMQGWGAWPVCSREIGATNIEPEPEPEPGHDLGLDPGPDPDPGFDPDPALDPDGGQDPGPAPDPSAGSEPVQAPWNGPQNEAAPGQVPDPDPGHGRVRGQDRTRAHGSDRAPHRGGVPPAAAPAPVRPAPTP